MDTTKSPIKKAQKLLARFAITEEVPGFGYVVNLEKSKSNAKAEVQKVINTLISNKEDAALIDEWKQIDLEISKLTR